MISYPSPNHDSRDGAVVDMLVIHYTGMHSPEGALARLCDPVAQVSAHYLIDETGDVHWLVSEGRRAWHAGEAHWRHHTNINARSIGIELVNPGHEFGYRPFTFPQMTSLCLLAKRILRHHPIPPCNIVGHADVAPRRKQDPGELFHWWSLAVQGIGLWPYLPSTTATDDPLAGLVEIGYELVDEEATITAFQRHYRPGLVDGVLDGETVGLIGGMLDLVRETRRD
ncbi:N-acetylmuramoyl-L-alanine amidase [Magnetospira sp. QH-2]|uniref:N-acetylmuramoyl-L-alanine amidase n=1 Tax=Magnetospira sp. (strain QH-2) TaxID=1288970 RepID=UPI0003E817F4|nr:N-acetylmuramoyl-L-alanine amidase [Magnetospira sp. QH-2]CCQ72826.1 putative N-acetylmuramoyl-L-alanine amidase [Magnetospira sp. QH-2]